MAVEEIKVVSNAPAEIKRLKKKVDGLESEVAKLKVDVSQIQKDIAVKEIE